jgi:hypothetical protein
VLAKSVSAARGDDPDHHKFHPDFVQVDVWWADSTRDHGPSATAVFCRRLKD